MTDQFPSALFRFFEAMPRQGPGAAAITRALYDRFRPSTRSAPKVADMGCGSGAAGLVLAEAGARVTGVDVHKPFLDSFTERAKRRGLADRVETQCASMIDSGLGDGTQDMIWSEGAVFTVGFDTALAAFHGLLRVGGRVVLSECSWLQDPALAPADIQSYWQEGYPGMGTVAENIAAADAQGYSFLHAELLPPSVWEAGFYEPMERLMAGMDPKADPDLWAVAQENRREIDLFRRHNAYYGYIFYVFARR